MGMPRILHGEFEPNLSVRIAPLRWLTEKKNEREWNHEQEDAWQHLKKGLKVLRFYDQAKGP